MQLYLIRHAESENNARPEPERVEDPPLTLRGHQQAGYLATWLQELPLDVLITSPFRRTLETSRYVSDTRRQAVEVWSEVFECKGCYRGWGDNTSGGIGFNRQQILRILPGASVCPTIGDSGWWNERSPETEAEAARRAAIVVDRLLTQFGPTKANVALIIHADFKRLLLGQMLGSAANAEFFGAMRNVGVSLVTWQAGRWQLEWLNSVSHLPARLLTSDA